MKTHPFVTFTKPTWILKYLLKDLPSSSVEEWKYGQKSLSSPAGRISTVAFTSTCHPAILMKDAIFFSSQNFHVSPKSAHLIYIDFFKFPYYVWILDWVFKFPNYVWILDGVFKFPCYVWILDWVFKFPYWMFGNVIVVVKFEIKCVKHLRYRTQ